jgi:hypothetical protein
MPEQVETAAIYGILRVFWHDSRERYRDRNERPSMVLKLVHSWNAAGASPVSRVQSPDPASLDSEDDVSSLDYDDPEAILIRERKAEKQRQQDSQAVFQLRQEQRQTFEQEQDEDERRLREWRASVEYRHAVEQMAADLDDARRATVWARDRAAAEQQHAREALEAVRRNALVVVGDRVYFTRDGQHLYGEDDREITNGATVADAQRQQRARPDATTYEEYADRKNAEHQATDRVQKLGESLDRLDILDKRIKKGDLSPDELAQASRDKQAVIDGLPADARAEYERLHAVRQDANNLSYRAADPAFAAAPDLSTEFQRAGTVAAAVQPTADKDGQQQVDRRTPVYKSAPDF